MMKSTWVVLVGVTAFVIGGVLGYVVVSQYFVLGDEAAAELHHMALEREAEEHLLWLDALEGTDRRSMERQRRYALDRLKGYLNNAVNEKLADRVKAYLDQHSAPQRKGDSPTSSPG